MRGLLALHLLAMTIALPPINPAAEALVDVIVAKNMPKATTKRLLKRRGAR